MSEPKYDFNFICLSLGLIPIHNDGTAINIGAIVCLRPGSDNPASTLVTLHGGEIFCLSPSQMFELENAIKQRAEDGKILAREAFKQNAVMQNEVIQELQRGVVGAAIVGAGKRRHS